MMILLLVSLLSLSVVMVVTVVSLAAFLYILLSSRLAQNLAHVVIDPVLILKSNMLARVLTDNTSLLVVVPASEALPEVVVSQVVVV